MMFDLLINLGEIGSGDWGVVVGSLRLGWAALARTKLTRLNLAKVSF